MDRGTVHLTTRVVCAARVVIISFVSRYSLGVTMVPAMSRVLMIGRAGRQGHAIIAVESRGVRIRKHAGLQ
jgi:hypothetical protein